MKIAESLPRLSYTRDGLDLMLSQGIDRVHMMHHRIHGKFADLCDDMYFFSMVQADGKPFFTHEQAITILEKIPRLHEIFYENGDYLDTSWIFAWSYTRIAEHYADMGEGEKSVRYLKSAAEYARAMDEYLSGLKGGYCYTDEQNLPKLPMEKRHTSLLASPEFDYPTCVNWYRPDAEESYVERLKKDLSHPRFDFIRGELDGLSL